MSLFQSALKHILPNLYCLALTISAAYTRRQVKWSLSLCQFSLKSIETIVTFDYLSLWVQEVVLLILNTRLNEDNYFSILLAVRYEHIFFQTHSTAQFNA